MSTSPPESTTTTTTTLALPGTPGSTTTLSCGDDDDTVATIKKLGAIDVSCGAAVPPLVLNLFEVVEQLIGQMITVMNAQEKRQREYANGFGKIFEAFVKREQEFENLGISALSNVAKRHDSLADELHSLVKVLEKWSACPTEARENLDDVRKRLVELLGSVPVVNETPVPNPSVTKLSEPTLPSCTPGPTTLTIRPKTPPTTPTTLKTLTAQQPRRNIYAEFVKFKWQERCLLSVLAEAVKETADANVAASLDLSDVPDAAAISKLLARLGIKSEDDNNSIYKVPPESEFPRNAIVRDIEEACKTLQQVVGGADGYRTLSADDKRRINFLLPLLRAGRNGDIWFAIPVEDTARTAQVLAALGIRSGTPPSNIADRTRVYHVPVERGYAVDDLIKAMEVEEATNVVAAHAAKSPSRAERRAAAARAMQYTTPASAADELWTS